MSTNLTMTFVCLLGLAAAANSRCGRDSVDCDYHYEVTGTSQANGKLYDEDGNEISSIDISADAGRCPTVKIKAHHREGAELLAPVHPTGSCVSNVAGNKTSTVSFDHRVSCACDDSWDWYLTDPAPPLKFKVKVRPVAACRS